MAETLTHDVKASAPSRAGGFVWLALMVGGWAAFFALAIGWSVAFYPHRKFSAPRRR